MANHLGTTTGRSHRILLDLADTLGCPVDAFLDGSKPEHLAMTEELLSLWTSVGDAQARRRILDYVRAVKTETEAGQLA
jgi:hypothetical protein